jgi:outer membrane protein OmpA-like peptidoglycan-associated protein
MTMVTNRERRRVEMCLAPLLGLCAVLLIAQGAAQTALSTVDSRQLLAGARIDLKAAQDLGAKRHLPRDYETTEAALAAAEAFDETTAESARGAAYRRHVERAAWLARQLLAKARLVRELREAKEPWQAVADRYDGTLLDVARAARVPLDSTLAGAAAARALTESLDRWRVRRQVQVDSLALLLRHADRRCQEAMADQESTLTAVRVELSTARQRLWEAELRAGVAEADRSASESVLNQRREREYAVREIAEAFGKDEGTVLLTPAGDVILHVFGFSFASGSAELSGDAQPLLDKLKAALAKFPLANVRLEGHTDNTGSREANLRLSRRRAETVASLLLAAGEIAAERIETEGFGPDRPLAPNDSPEGRARNRRIDVVILTGGE